MEKDYNIYELSNFLKTKRKFMSVKEIAKETGSTITSVSRKIKKLVPKTLEKKVKKMQVGKRTSKCPVGYYRYKK